MPAESSARAQGATPALPSSLTGLKWLVPGMPSQVSVSYIPSRPSDSYSSPDQALAILKLLDGVRGLILAHYGMPLSEAAANYNSYRCRDTQRTTRLCA
jgi:hypothetical protein